MGQERVLLLPPAVTIVWGQFICGSDCKCFLFLCFDRGDKKVICNKFIQTVKSGFPAGDCNQESRFIMSKAGLSR